MPTTDDQPQRRGIEGLAEDFVGYRRLLGGRNAVYTRLLSELESLLCGPRADAELRARLERAWRASEFVAFYDRPLLLQAALRYDALSTPARHPLARALRSEDPDPSQVTRDAVSEALDADRISMWLALATRNVQTNDVSRSVAWLWPMSLVPERPIVLVDVGCSAGLNLLGDQLDLRWTRADGSALEMRRPNVLARIGFDRSPIDVTDDDDATWLRACVWPGDHGRLRWLDRAIDAARQHRPPIDLKRVSAKHVVGRLRQVVSAADPSATVVVIQTFVRDYIEMGERRAYEEQLDEWMAGLPGLRAVMLELELADDPREPPAELVARPSGHGRIALARCSYHPSQLEVNEPGARAFRRLFERSP